MNGKKIFAPSYTQASETKDHQGRTVVSAGTKVNPLDHVSWGIPLLFIDGDEQSHVTWAIKQTAIRSALTDLIQFGEVELIRLSNSFDSRHLVVLF